MSIMDLLQKLSHTKIPDSLRFIVPLITITVGGAMMVASFLADWLGIGGEAGFGGKQLMLLLAGFFLVLIGLLLPYVKNIPGLLDKVILSAILLLGFFLRVYDLG